MKFLRTTLILAALMLVVPAAASADPLQITTATNHTGYVSLQGYRIATSTTNVCITLSNSPAKTGPVNFYLDSQTTIYHTENTAPWDMLSGGTNDATGACRLGTLATGNHYVKATWGGGGNDQESFTVGPAPDTSISSVADADSAPTFIDEDGNGSEQVNVTFSGTNSVNRRECSISGATTQAYTTCTSVWAPTVNVGSNTVSVRACDNAGCDATPATNTFTMQAGADTTPPNTTITSQPPSPTNQTDATVGFTGTDNVGVVGFECKWQSEPNYTPCTSPQAYFELLDGPHTTSVRAKDAAGNVDPTPAIATWTVDTAAPDTTITAQPSDPTTSTSAAFSFTSSETSSFECALDGAAYASCTSPKNYTGLAVGSHTFTVRSTDGAGNTDATPSSYTWTVNAPSGDPLVSTGDPATASSQEASRPPSLALDQNATTRWGSILDGAGGTGHDNEWIYVDLGQSYNVSRVRLNWEAAYATAYKIQVSDNASTWTDAYSTTTGDGAIDDLTLTATGRYVRMLGVTRATAWGYSLWELEVYGTPNGSPPPAACADSIDNDGDGLTDYPADPGCASASDTDETNAGSPTPPPAPGTWNLRLNDDFSNINTSLWGFKFWWGGDTFWPNQERQVYHGADRCTSDGNALLETAVKETGTVTASNNSTVNSNGEPYQYTSCWMSTGGQKQPTNVPAGYLFTYGYAEARIWMSGGQGVWPGFWMQGRDSVNGTSFDDGHEIDIVELIGSRPSEANLTYHGPSGASGGVYTCACNLTAGYHTYAIDWEPGSLVWYVDGVARKTLNRSDIPTTPRYLMFNLAIGGSLSWPGAPDASTPFPSVTKVDWVHVWQH